MLSTLSAPPSLTREKIVKIARSLPADIRVLSRLTELLQDMDSELSEISELLRSDVTLAAKIVRTSNSALFGGGRAIATIEEAVNRVGFGQILKLVGTATAGRLSESTLPCYDISAKMLRDNMLYGAFAAEALARPARIDPRLAFSAGLLRSVGIMVLDRVGRDDTVSSPLYTPAQWPDYLTWEKRVFGLTSSEVTAMLLDEWEFPEVLGQAIRAHYVADSGDMENRLAVLLNVANGMARFVSRSFQGEDKLWSITPEKLAAVNLSEADFEPAIVETETAFAAASRALR